MANHYEQTIKGVRSMLGDYAAKNRLLGDMEEYSDQEIMDAMDATVEEVNYGDVHITSFTVQSLHDANPYLLRLGAAKHALFARMTQKARNSIPYSDGAGYVDKESNLNAYQNMYIQLDNTYNTTRRQYKATLNLNAAMR